MPDMTPAVPPQQFNNVPGPNGVPQQPSPGMGEAIMDAVRALAYGPGSQGPYPSGAASECKRAARRRVSSRHRSVKFSDSNTNSIGAPLRDPESD